MTKSKSFWAVAALLSLAVAAFSGHAVYARMAQHFSGDAVALKPSPVPPPSAAAEPEAGEETGDNTEPQPAQAEQQKPAENEKSRAVRTSFEYKDSKAKSVAIAGSFTSWKDVKMTKKDGVWRKDVYILPGTTYPYHFTVDGKKRTDPGRPTSPTGDSLVTVK